MSGLEGQVAIVTGGAGGIGRAIVLRLARDGADVVVADLNGPAAEKVAQEVRALGRRSIALAVDVCIPAQVQDMVTQTVAALGKLDIMVANAGIVKASTLAEITEEMWDRTMDINAKGVFLCNQAAALQMIAQGHGGKVINASSGSGRRGGRHLTVYSASKFAVTAITQSLALELAPHKITVNAYCPGIVDTPMWAGLDQDMAGIPGAQRMVEKVAATPLGRVQTADDVANLVAFLASSDSDFLTGQAIIQDGGRVIM